jgi:hypothetical protein
MEALRIMMKPCFLFVYFRVFRGPSYWLESERQKLSTKYTK